VTIAKKMSKKRFESVGKRRVTQKDTIDSFLKTHSGFNGTFDNFIFREQFPWSQDKI